jgi:hypothetical protein
MSSVLWRRFFVDAVASVLFAGLFAARHHRGAVGVGCLQARRDGRFVGRLAEYPKHGGAVGFGGVGVPDRCGELNGAVRQLPVGPPTRPGVERLEQMMATAAGSRPATDGSRVGLCRFGVVLSPLPMAFRAASK